MFNSNINFLGLPFIISNGIHATKVFIKIFDVRSKLIKLLGRFTLQRRKKTISDHRNGFLAKEPFAEKLFFYDT